MLKRYHYVIAIVAAAFLAAMAIPATAMADSGFTTGLNLEYAIPADDWVSDPQDGLGLNLSGGYKFDMDWISITPEAVFNYSHFFPGDSGDETQYDYFLGYAGPRITFENLPVSPTLFAHVGGGAYLANGLTSDFDNQGLAVDAGLGLALIQLPEVTLGIEAKYNYFLADDELEEISFDDDGDDLFDDDGDFLDDSINDTNTQQWVSVGVKLITDF